MVLLVQFYTYSTLVKVCADIYDSYKHVNIFFCSRQRKSDPAYFNLNYGCWINLSVGLLLTIIASEVWMWISLRFKNSIL